MTVRHRLLITVLLATVVLSAVGAPERLPPRDPRYVFSGKPVVEFEGHVTDARSGEGLADAFVIVNMRTYRSVPFAHGVSGCNISSQIVKTDASGRYRVHWSWPEHGEEPPDDLSVNVKAYKQGWAHHPRARKTGSSFLVSMQRDFQMAPQEQPFSERVDTLARFRSDNCHQIWDSDLAHEMSKALYDEAWQLLCEPVLNTGITWVDSWSTGNLLSGLIDQTWRTHHPNATDADHRGWWDQHFSRLRTGMSGYPWEQLRTFGDPENPPFSMQDVSDYCGVYADSLRRAVGEAP